MISKELSATLGFAVKEAKRRRHEYVSIEHILFAILNDPNGIEIIENCGANGNKDKMGYSFFGADSGDGFGVGIDVDVISALIPA